MNYVYIHSTKHILHNLVVLFEDLEVSVRNAFRKVSRKAFWRPFLKATLGAPHASRASTRGCGVLKSAMAKGSSKLFWKGIVKGIAKGIASWNYCM